MNQNKSAFTLVELIIVVAILGILAAIAIPNVNDALIRAKVARMKNDTRVLGMAIENYVVDQGWYPYGQNCDPTDYLCSVCGSPESVEKTQIPHLFMPVSYAHSAPIDIFHELYNSRTEKLVSYSVTYAHIFQQLEKRNNCLATFAPPST
ncbi:MAG: type II secretion system protein, partial [bacterium]